jgi:hypothetical protein
MTTTVKVITHSWPVLATTTDATQVEGVEDATHVETVDPNREREFHLTSTRSLTLKELPKPEAVENDTDEDQARAPASSDAGAEEAA